MHAMPSVLAGHLSYLADKLLRQPQHVIEIILLALFIYYTIMFIRGTRAVAVLRGALLLALIFGVANVFSLETINLLYRTFAQFVVFSLIVMFAPELRRALMQIGRQTFVRNVLGSRSLAEPVREAVRVLANKQIGALVALERTVGLRGYANTGVTLDCEVSAPTLISVFFPKNPLHDGGVIIENGRILAASCIFPLSNNPLSHLMGTRHRAALGMSEETDALVICVSEESGKISIFENGVWDEGVSVTEVATRLTRATV
jgi:diadenylate cyclase